MSGFIKSVFGLLILAGLLYAGYMFAGQDSAKSPDSSRAEIYLVDGGRGYLVLEPSAVGAMRVANGFIGVGYWDFYGVDNQAEVEHLVSIVGVEMTIEQTVDFEYNRRIDGVLTSRFILRPSETIEGDWDLTDARAVAHCTSESLAEYKASDRWIRDQESASLGMLDDGTILDARLKPGTAAVKSFLHRVNDPRVVDYMGARLARTRQAEDLDKIREITDQSNDPFLALHRIELEAKFGDVALAERMLAQWEAEQEAAAGLLLKDSKLLVSTMVERSVFLRDYPDMPLISVMFSQVGDNPSGAELRKWLGRVGELDVLLPTPNSEFVLVTPSLMGNSEPKEAPAFLELHYFTKEVRMDSTLALFQGERQRALEQLMAVYRIGLSLGARWQISVSGMIGAEVCDIGIEGLEDLLLNACEEESEFDRLWAELEQINNMPRLKKEMLPLLLVPMEDSVDAWGMNSSYNMVLSVARYNVSTAKFLLLRMALVAKRLRMLEGRFPSSDAEFLAFFPDGFPADPFSSSGTLRYCQRGADFYVYSIGPDAVDDRAAIEYDVSNGTKSSGDVLMRIPSERRYPFPRGGVRANDAADLNRQFPNGLPEDIFGWGMGQLVNLSILDSTPTEPTCVFSVGPDGERDLIRDLSSSVPPPAKGTYPLFERLLNTRHESSTSLSEYRYDPSNGTSSAGDIFVTIPRRTR